METIVCKFGGTSVATKEKIERIGQILKSDARRRCVVLSAPGKAPGINTKVTDLLIQICEFSLKQKDVKKQVDELKKR